MVLLVVQITEQANPIIDKAAIGIVALRILHGLAYVLGVPLLRSLAFVGSLLSVFTILWQLLLG